MESLKGKRLEAVKQCSTSLVSLLGGIDTCFDCSGSVPEVLYTGGNRALPVAGVKGSYQMIALRTSDLGRVPINFPLEDPPF